VARQRRATSVLSGADPGNRLWGEKERFKRAAPRSSPRQHSNPPGLTGRVVYFWGAR